MLEQAKFTYSPLNKAIEKQIKTIEDQEKKQIKALEEHGKQLVKSRGEKETLTLLQQKKFMNHFMNQEKKLSNCLMIILKLHLRVNVDQSMEKD